MISIRATANIIVVGGHPLLRDDKKYIRVTITNTGDQKTTITNLVGEYYSTCWKRLLRNPDTLFVVTNPAHSSGEFPYGIGPGEQWAGSMLQSPELENQARKGFLFVGIDHSSSKRSVLQRVKISKRPKMEAHNNG